MIVLCSFVVEIVVVSRFFTLDAIHCIKHANNKQVSQYLFSSCSQGFLILVQSLSLLESKWCVFQSIIVVFKYKVYMFGFVAEGRIYY